MGFFKNFLNATGLNIMWDTPEDDSRKSREELIREVDILLNALKVCNDIESVTNYANTLERKLKVLFRR